MHDDDQPMASTDQDSWVQLAMQMRDELAKRIPEIGGMEPGEIGQFIDAIRDTYWLHLTAATWDKKLELELARTTAE